MRVELWGTYPPPIGGVTIHVFRLIHHLHSCDNSIILKNFGKNSSDYKYVQRVFFPILEFIKLLFSSGKIIHLHSNNVCVFFLFSVFGWRHKLGVTLHNKNLIKEQSYIKRKVIECFLFQLNFIILNDSTYKDQLAIKFRVHKNKMRVLPAFIPPLACETKGLDKNIIDFREKYSYLISANAYKLRLDEGVDVYGLDLLISLMKELLNRGVDAGLVFCLPIIGDKEYYDNCLKRIHKLGLMNNILIIQKELTNGFEVWRLSDLFIRPTSTDMEGLSLKEALYFGTPAIASDVCVRPSATILFENRNFDDLLAKVMFAYMNRDKDDIPSNVFSENSVEDILNIYRSIL